MLQKTFLALALATSVFAAGCGGGGGGGSSAPAGGGAVETRNDVAGPLDTVQGPLSSQVLAPLQSAVAGTPLAGVVNCANQVVVEDVLDIADALALGLRPDAADPTAALDDTAADVQAEIGDLVADLQGLVTSLADGTGCSARSPAHAAIGNPLTGTDFAALGSQLLPVLNQVQGQLGGGALSLDQLSGLLGQITQTFDGMSGMFPTDAADAPVVGPLLALVSQTLADVQRSIAAAASGSHSNTAMQVTVTVQNLLGGLLTDVIPLSAIEGTSGQPAAVSGPIRDAIGDLTSIFGWGLGFVTTAELVDAMADPTSALINPLEDDVLGLILGPIRSAIVAGSVGVPVATGTPLDGVLGTIAGVLSGGVGGDPLGSLFGSLLGGVGSCPLAGTPLATLCGVLGA